MRTLRLVELKRTDKRLQDALRDTSSVTALIAFAVSRPQRVTLNEILVRPTVQAM